MLIPTKKLCRLVLSIAFVFLSFIVSAQTDSIYKSSSPKITLNNKEVILKSDSTKKNIQTHSPRKATIFSALLPGAGQVYNKKYWKLPIVYGTLGAVGYLAYKQQDSINKINRDLDSRFDKDTNTTIIFKQYSDQQMLTAYDATLKKRDLFFIVGIALYAIQIVDANVDAHLFYFDVSDDLSLKITPEVNRLAYAPSGSYSAGIRLTLKLK